MSLLLAGVEVPVPKKGAGAVSPPVEAALAEATASLAGAAGQRHRLREEPVDLAGYVASGLPARTMGRGIEEDPLFFAAPLAAGAALRRKG